MHVKFIDTLTRDGPVDKTRLLRTRNDSSLEAEVTGVRR